MTKKYTEDKIPFWLVCREDIFRWQMQQLGLEKYPYNDMDDDPRQNIAARMPIPRNFESITTDSLQTFRKDLLRRII